MTQFKNLRLQNHWANFSQTWHKASLVEGNSGFINKDHSILNKEIWSFSSLYERYDIHSFAQMFINLNRILKWAIWPVGLLFIISYSVAFSLSILSVDSTLFLK